MAGKSTLTSAFLAICPGCRDGRYPHWTACTKAKASDLTSLHGIPVALMDGNAPPAISHEYWGQPRTPVPEPPKGLKPTNPKTPIASDKIPFHLWPEVASAYGSLGMLDGTLKYGRSNFRAAGVKASIYIDAARRHLNAWFEGEECAADSGVPHLGHALACIAIILDARAAGRFTDDRMMPGGYIKEVEEILTPHVARLKAKHADRLPHHFTIKDAGITLEDDPKELK